MAIDQGGLGGVIVASGWNKPGSQARSLMYRLLLHSIGYRTVAHRCVCVLFVQREYLCVCVCECMCVRAFVCICV